jgi:hypothetical protein
MMGEKSAPAKDCEPNRNPVSFNQRFYDAVARAIPKFGELFRIGRRYEELGTKTFKRDQMLGCDTR